MKISSVRQPMNLGLGDAILCAEHLIGGEDFAVVLPDEFLLKKQKDSDLKNDKIIMKQKNIRSSQKRFEIQRFQTLEY